MPIVVNWISFSRFALCLYTGFQMTTIILRKNFSSFARHHTRSRTKWKVIKFSFLSDVEGGGGRNVWKCFMCVIRLFCYLCQQWWCVDKCLPRIDYLMDVWFKKFCVVSKKKIYLLALTTQRNTERHHCNSKACPQLICT